MAGTSTPYPAGRTGRLAGNTGHVSIQRAQEHQGARLAGGSGRRRVPDAAHDGHRTNLYADRTGG